MKRKDQVGGFTLMELLVVTAIFAVLAAILFPVFVSARQRASQASCISNLKQIGAAVAMYADDSDGFLPTGYGDEHDNTCDSASWAALLGHGFTFPLVSTALSTYLPATSKLYACPLATPIDYSDSDGAPCSNSPQVWKLSYSWNTYTFMQPRLLTQLDPHFAVFYCQFDGGHVQPTHSYTVLGADGSVTSCQKNKLAQITTLEGS